MKNENLNFGIPLFVHPKNDYTGSTRVLATIIETEYPDKKVRVICLNPDKRGFLSHLPNVEILSLPNVIIKNHWIPFLSLFIITNACTKFINRYIQDYDFIYLNTIVAAFGVKGAIKTGKPIIWHIHEKFKHLNLNIKKAEKIFESTKSHRIFVSQYTKSCYPEKKECTWEIKYNYLPQSFLNKVKVVPPDQRDRKGILMISSLSKAKGVDVFVKVAELLPNYKFTIIISASEAQITDFFGWQSIPTNCTILSSQSDIHPWLHRNSLLLNLSNPDLLVETFGMTILEGMAYGLPAIVPNVGGPTELIQDGYNGYAIDTTDINKIISSIKKLTDSEAIYKKFANNALDSSKKFRSKTL